MCRIKVKVSEYLHQVLLQRLKELHKPYHHLSSTLPVRIIPKALCLEACNATDPIDVGYDDLYNIE